MLKQSLFLAYLTAFGMCVPTFSFAFGPKQLRHGQALSSSIQTQETTTDSVFPNPLDKESVSCPFTRTIGKARTFAMAGVSQFTKHNDQKRSHDRLRGPPIWELFGSLLSKGFLDSVEDWKEEYGPVFTVGPATFVTGSSNVEIAYKNFKSPFVLPGLPSGSGLGSDNPAVTSRIRKMIVPIGAKKKSAREAIARSAPLVKEHMNDLIIEHGSQIERINYKELISKPLGKKMSSELMFGVSTAPSPGAVASIASEIQTFGASVAEYFGPGILRALVDPGRVVRAVQAVKNFNEALESMMLKQGIPKSCPMGQLKEALQAGDISKNDALQASGVFVVTGSSALESATGNLIWTLALPENAELQRACRKEIDEILGGPNNVIQTAEQVGRMHKLKAVFAEIQRLAAISAPGYARRDFTVNGKVIKKGSWVLNTGRAHEDLSKQIGSAEWKSAPREFHWESWINHNGEFNEELYTQFSFYGKGANICPARRFGFEGVVTIAAATLSHFENIRFPDGVDESKIRPENSNPIREQVIISADARTTRGLHSQ